MCDHCGEGNVLELFAPFVDRFVLQGGADAVCFCFAHPKMCKPFSYLVWQSVVPCFEELVFTSGTGLVSNGFWVSVAFSVSYTGFEVLHVCWDLCGVVHHCRWAEG